MAFADFSVFPTLNDSFGAVLAEAMAAELPVVSSIYAYATRDLIEDGVTGYRFDPRDIASATETIEKMINMQDTERKKMGRRAYEKVRQHTCADAALMAADYIQKISGKGI
jgi:glycosyltransferase involved in cell wall biosynthesis